MEVTKNGDFIYWPITINNEGPNANTNVKVQDYMAPGLAYQSYTLGPPAKGTFNIGTGLWTVGTHNVGITYVLTIKYKVVDITQATQESGVYGFALNAVVSGDNIDPNDINNTLSDFVEIIEYVITPVLLISTLIASGPSTVHVVVPSHAAILSAAAALYVNPACPQVAVTSTASGVP